MKWLSVLMILTETIHGFKVGKNVAIKHASYYADFYFLGNSLKLTRRPFETKN